MNLEFLGGSTYKTSGAFKAIARRIIVRHILMGSGCITCATVRQVEFADRDHNRKHVENLQGCRYQRRFNVLRLLKVATREASINELGGYSLLLFGVF